MLRGQGTDVEGARAVPVGDEPIALIDGLIAVRSELVAFRNEFVTDRRADPGAGEGGCEGVHRKEFIEQWAYVEREMHISGDTAEYLQMSRGCRECADLAALVERRYAAGGLVAWRGWRIGSIEPRGPAGTTFLVRALSAPLMYKESAEGRVKMMPEKQGAWVITVKRARASWVVTGRAEVQRERPSPSDSGSDPGSTPA